ncbi:NAD-binding protein [Candidatus Mycobacterium wuenschmannii]|uniref:NAD-binding protein n=1 Tax=Candidatus Mycobacterium wuenschmannii TaxID=3027808 RepID=A0ABY8VY58_9MYCO|nr:NAD(P)-binding protein [Candidatus Mycobacterium wuenschmannii]WIM88565.1 NAD-binding protein [Candidatus Mycobacterium wuenschmannii]
MSASSTSGQDAPPRTFQQKILAFLTNPRWYWVLAPAGILAFLLGMWGYFSYVPEGGGHHSLSDAIYGAAKLFLLHAAPQPETHVGYALDIARYLAPIVAGWAALIALISLLHDRVQQMLIPLRRNHVVLCGLGYVGFEFLRQLRLAGYKAIVIEADPDNPRIEACRDWGYPVIVGDAQLKSTLEAAGVQRASRLLAVTPDSVVNTEIITRARRLVNNKRRLQCLARVSDPSLCVFLRIEESNHGDDQTALDFFNTDEIGARLLLDRYPFTTSARPHILVAHLDTLGSELILHAARIWNDKRTDTSTPLPVTVVGEHAGERIAALLDDHPALEQVCTFTSHSLSVRDLARLGGEPVTHAYVTAQHDERSVETALKLRHALDPAVPVVAALWRAYGVADLFQHSTTPPSANLAVVKMLQETCTVELVEGGSFEAIAHEIHRRYRLMQPDGGASVPLWSALSESLKKSNRAQARHIAVKLRSIGCEITPLRDWQAKEFTFTDEELTRLSIMEHDRWAQEKMDAGVKTDPHFVPWHELPGDIAEWDTNFVRAIPAMLAAVGLQIVDIDETAPRYPVTSNTPHSVL